MISARLRPRAELDLVEQGLYYREARGDDLGERFLAAARTALRDAESMPGVGSSRIGHICGILDLRARRVTGFPFDWYYLTRADHLDVVRLLAETRDLPSLLGGVGQPE